MLYSRLLLIFISNKLFYQMRNILWKYNGIDMSQFKTSKHLNIVFTEVLKITMKKQSEEIYFLLLETIKFIEKKCIKIKYKNRFYPLDIIKSIS